MKFGFSSLSRVVGCGCVGVVACAISAAAQTNVPAPSLAAPAAAAASRSVPVALPYGVADVIKLAHAGIGDDTLIAFVGSTHSQYGLGATEILYLKEQGVSDRVVTAMLQNGRNNGPAVPATAMSAATTSDTQYPTTYSPPAPTYISVAPAEAPASNVFVIRNPEPTYVYSDYYPTYYGWNGFYYPPVSFSFGFGGRFHDGGFPHSGFSSRGFPRGSVPSGGFPHGGSPRVGFSGGGIRGGGSPGHHR